MNPPTSGLRPLFNKSNSAQRVELIVPAGDEIHVTDAVAAQLPGSFAPAKPAATKAASKVLALDEIRTIETTKKPKAKAADAAGD